MLYQRILLICAGLTLVGGVAPADAKKADPKPAKKTLKTAKKSAMASSSKVSSRASAKLPPKAEPKPAPKPSPKPKPSSVVRVGDWRAHARRFTGESVRVREEAIEALKEDPKLSEKLKKALGTPDHFLALDVISVLKLRSFFATLLAFAEKDKTGYSYHVINSLMTPSQIPEVSRVYLQRLTDPMISPASKIALIDALGRMQTRLEIPLVRTLLKDTYPEIRSATLYYVRTAVLKWKRPEYLVFLDEAITDPTYQLRMQTLHLARELPEKLRTTRVGAFRKLFAPCLEDPVAEVKALCREMNEKLPGGAT